MKQKLSFFEVWRSGLFHVDLWVPFCDINWDQKGISQGHVKTNYSVTRERHY